MKKGISCTNPRFSNSYLAQIHRQCKNLVHVLDRGQEQQGLVSFPGSCDILAKNP